MMNRRLAITSVILFSLGISISAFAQHLPESISAKDYSYSYWKHGHRKHDGDQSKDILAIETGYYALELDMAQINQAKFALLSDQSDYVSALEAKSDRLADLKDLPFEVQLEVEGKVYTATSCLAAKERANGQRFQGTMLWESARFMQHYEIQGIEFEATDGERLATDASLDVVAWPQSFTFTANVTPVIDYQNGAVEGVNGKAICALDTPHIIKHERSLEHEQFTVESWVKIPKFHMPDKRSWILCKTKNEANDGNFGFSLSKGNLRALMNIGGKAKENRHWLDAKPKSITTDKWHHLAMSYDGKVMSLYVDGKLHAEKKIGKKRNLAVGDLSLGKRADGNGLMAPVIMDELRVWNRALSSKELTQHVKRPQILENRDGLAYENNFEDSGPLSELSWKNAKFSIGLGDRQHGKYVEKNITSNRDDVKKETLILNVNLTDKATEHTRTKIVASVPNNTISEVKYYPEWNAQIARIVKLKRSWDVKDKSFRHYDDIDLTVTSDKSGNVPFMLDFKDPASITGICPILCDENGVPTGIPVQLSKNWHFKPLGSYMRASMLLPTVNGTRTYKLRIIYGFYGDVPSASHSQLSLVGYGGNGRWDQLAIGAWGETYCMDPDMSLVDVAVTDVRMLMARNGENGKKWGWTTAGWGGDWLGLNNEKGQKLLFHGMKTAYLAHGPCLTEVRYAGNYGANQEVGFSSTVRTLRTNDHARTFTSLKYRFNKEVNADGWLFKMGRSHKLVTPQFSYGNENGLIEEVQIPKGVKSGQKIIAKRHLSGTGPWWISYSKSMINDGRDWGKGYRALIVRGYKVTSGGKTYTKPAVEFPVHKSTKDGADVDFLLTAPLEIERFMPGDVVELEIEWITLPNKAADYYGGNVAFRQHLVENPASWKTTHREAIGNDLKVNLTGGKLVNAYPIIINTESEQVSVQISGGVGYVPIRFEGVKSPTEYALYQVVGDKHIKLDQTAHGNDFWQTDYDAKTQKYSMTFNLLLDGLHTSEWVFKP